jgi:hypothetical protein
VWEVEENVGPLCLGSGEGHLTIIAGREYGANSESA